jgi:hypothetical protein
MKTIGGSAAPRVPRVAAALSEFPRGKVRGADVLGELINLWPGISAEMS